MSVYIKGMEMPTECSRKGCPLFSCTAAYETGMICTVLNEYVEPNKKNPRCPLIPVPEHGRMIDADALQSVTIEQQSNDYNIKAVPRNWAYAFCAFEEIVADAPTIIPADKEDGE